MENLLVRVLERFTERLIVRQRAMYAADLPVHREVAAGDALPRRGPRVPEGLVRAPGAGLEPPRAARARRARRREWRAVLAEAFEQARREHSIDMPLERARRRSSRRSTRGSSSSVSPGSRRATARCSTGSTTGWRRGAMTIDRRAGHRHGARSRPALATPTRRGTSSATASASSTRSTARASRRCSSCRRGRSSTRGTGRCRSRTSPATAGWSRSTRAATAAPTARPSPSAYPEQEFAGDAVAVLDATATERAVLVSLSRGAERSLHFAADQPERVDGLVFIAPALPLPPAPRLRRRCRSSASRATPTTAGTKWNRHYWLEHYEDFLEFFFSQV